MLEACLDLWCDAEPLRISISHYASNRHSSALKIRYPAFVYALTLFLRGLIKSHEQQNHLSLQYRTRYPATMPFRDLYREQMMPSEFQTPGALCIVHPDYEEQSPSREKYHEIDFKQLQYQQTPLSSTARHTTAKYPTAMDVDDDLSHLQSDKITYLGDVTNDASTNGPFSYSQLFGTEETQNCLPIKRTGSVATETSTTVPSLTSIGTSPEEQICPLITGEVDTCQPDRCGPNAPCMKFTNIPPIEECVDVPCIKTRSPKAEKPAAVKRMATDPTSMRPSRPTRQYSGKNPPKPSTKADAKRRAKQAHSLVEKKYRENLNAKLCQLNDTLKVVRFGPKKNQRQDEDDDSDELNAVNQCSNSKFRKGDVLDDALAYVDQTEVEMRHMENEIARLNDMVGMLERRLKYERSGRGMMMPMQVRPI